MTLAERIVEAMGAITPTEQQRALIDALARFCSNSSPSEGAGAIYRAPTGGNGQEVSTASVGMADNRVFLINGYAGTGKTSVVAALVKALGEMRRPTVLLAPTGRAAKVLGTLAGKKAMTIHRKIYAGMGDGTGVVGVGENPHSNTIFIVDEASMIDDGQQSSLLADLVQYVYGSGHNCRMILLGDGAQLPPVGYDRSPAMAPSRLRQLGLRVTRAVMTQTVRQKARSGILYNATMLRRNMVRLVEGRESRVESRGSRVEGRESRVESRESRVEGEKGVKGIQGKEGVKGIQGKEGGMGNFGEEDGAPELAKPQLRVKPFRDVRAIGGEELEEALIDSYRDYGIDDTILITRSNKRAMEFNIAIRRQILEKNDIISLGESLLIAKNNYFWTAKVKGADFVANGDIVKVERVYGTEMIGPLQFADVALTMPDRDISFDAKIILNSLNAETAGLDPAFEQMLYNKAFAGMDPSVAANPVTARRVLHTDPYYNALRVKYAYAVTCHKAQGGQWSSVFVDMANIAPEAYSSLEFYRWLYTATTRARTLLTYIAPQLDED